MRWYWKALLLLGALLAVSALPLFIDAWQRRNPRDVGYARETDFILKRAAFQASLYHYSHGYFPTNAEELSKTMSATSQNLEAFYDSRGNLIDGWGSPIAIKLQPDGRALVVYSFGANRKDDGGTSDDRVVIAPTLH